jgi:iron complex transport system substrate-binding protein
LVRLVARIHLRPAIERLPVHRRSTFLPVALIPALAIALSGCATLEAAFPTASGSPSPTATATADPYQSVTVDNCGFEVTFDHAPQRVVTVKSTSTEMLLALGLGDRIVGLGYQDGPVPSVWADDLHAPVLSDRVPSEEVVLGVEPDLVYAGWESNFSPEGAGNREDLAGLGVASYVSPSACQSSGQPAKLTWNDIFSDIEEMGRIFGVQDDAQKLVESQQKVLDEVRPNNGLGRTALWYSSGSDTPYVGAGIGAPQLLMESVGLTNIAADVDATWAPFNWEAVVDADPDFIILIDADWNTAAHKIEMLESNPATAQLTAVKFGNYLTLPFAASEAGVRSVESAASLAHQLIEQSGP